MRPLEDGALTVLLASLIAVGLAALATFYLPAWSSIGAAAALVGVLILGGGVPYALGAAALAAAAGYAWRRYEARAASRWLPEAPQAPTVARPKAGPKETKKPDAPRQAA